MSSTLRHDAFLTLDGDEDFLLDWDFYNSTKSRCTPTLPRWWYQLSTRQRNIVRALLATCSALGIIALIVTIAFKTSSGPPARSGSGVVGVTETAAVSNSYAHAPTPAPAPPPPRVPRPQPEPAWPDAPADIGTFLPGGHAPPPEGENVYSPDVGAELAPEDADPLPEQTAPQPPAHAVPAFPRCVWSSYRLPDTARPFLYDVALQLDTALVRVNGTVRIALALSAPAPCLVLHAAPPLNVAALPLETSDGTVPVELQWPEDPRDGQLHVAFPQELPVGDVFLTLTFDFPLTDGLGGFYRAQFPSADGTQEVLAVTQFAAMRARKAFPCLDEPALKAPVKMQVTAPAKVTVLFNTDAEGSADAGGGMTHYTFKQTPPIATYLIALVAGDLAHEEVLVVRQEGQPALPVRVWARRSAAASLSLAAHAAAAAVQGMEEVLGVPYAGGRIGKLDLVGVPGFAAGAMENWGLITFREADLLVPPGDPEQGGASVQQLYRVPLVVAHEVAHMWFGDLVTLPWWTEAWLTEGFARYFERIAAGFFWNSYDKSALPTEFTAAGPLTYMHAFVAEVLDPALTADALPSTTALSRPEAAVHSEADAQAAFGRVANDKGASVLRMLHAHMLRVAAAGGPEEAAWQVRRRLRDAAAPPPEDPFFNALRGYLEAYKFGTGHTDTLLEAMETETGMPLPLWAQGWAKREGSPMLMASRAQGQLRIEQFRQGGAHSEEAEAWWLPLTYHSIGWFGASADPEGGVPWLEMNATVAAVPWPEDAEAVKVNAGQLGAFRVAYSEDLWEALHIHEDALPPADRAGLLTDSWALAITTDLAVSHFLRFVSSVAGHLSTAAAPAPAPASPPPPPSPKPTPSGAVDTPDAAAAPGLRPPKAPRRVPDHHRPAAASSTKSDKNGTAGPPLAASSPSAHTPPKHAGRPGPSPRAGRRLAEAASGEAPPVSPPQGEHGVWAALQSLQQLRSLVDAAELEEEVLCGYDLALFMSAMLLGPAADAFGLSSTQPQLVGAAEPWEQRLTRAALLQLHATLGPTTRVAELAMAAVPAYLHHEQSLHADVRGALFAIAVQSASPGDDVVQRLRMHLLSSTDPEERGRVLRALAFNSNVNAAFEFVRSGQVEAQNIRMYIEAMAAVSQERRGEMWELCQVYKENLKDLIGGTAEAQELAVMQLLARVAAGFASEARAEEAEDFFRGALGAVLPQYAAEAVAEIRTNAAARARVVQDTCAWVEEYEWEFFNAFDYAYAAEGAMYMPMAVDDYGFGYDVENVYML